MKYIVVVGDPGTGFSFIGPFKTREAAEDFDDAVEDTDHWVSELNPPEES